MTVPFFYLLAILPFFNEPDSDHQRKRLKLVTLWNC
jgi:hypothetical protein